MTHRILDRAQETTTSSGPGALNLAGATTRMLSFAEAGLSDGDTFLGLIEHLTAAEFELALCTFHAGTPNYITRATPRRSSTGTSTVDFSTGTKTVSLVDLAGIRHHACRVEKSGTSTEMADNDCVVVIKKTVGAAHAVSLPANPVPDQEVCVIDGKGDAGTNNITVTDPNGYLINGEASLVLSSDRERWWLHFTTDNEWLLV
jgi:hypothetical protein